MASRLAELQRVAQLKVGAQVIARMFAAFSLLDPEDLDGTFEDWLSVVTPIVTDGRRTSSLVASGYLQTIRATHLGVSDGFRPVLADAVDARALATSMLVTGPVSIRSNLGKIPFDQAVDIAKARTAASGMRHALNGGRETIVATVKADKRARGYQRVASGNACEFCTMLASRGAVYGEESADFASHDRCGCTAEPVYT